MKRPYLVAVLLFVGSIWTASAQAQGMGGFGGNHVKDPIAEMKEQQSTIKSRLNTYSKAPSARARYTRPRVANPTSTDAYGRMDLAGRPVAGYPVTRKDPGGVLGPSYLSRGNSSIARRPPARRK